MISHEKLIERMTELDRKTAELGSEHPAILALVEYIANIHYILEDYEGAIRFYQRSLTMRARVLETDASMESKIAFIDNIHKLGILNRTLSRFDVAEAYYLKALNLTKEIFGPDHLKTAPRMNFLAGMYYSCGRYTEAENLVKDSLKVYSAYLGADHLYASFCHIALCLILRKQNREAEAKQEFDRVTQTPGALNTLTVDEGSWDLNESLNVICQMYMRQGRYEEAELLFRHILFTEARDLWPDNPVVAAGYHTLAELYLAHRLDKHAATLFRQALDIYEKTLPKHDERIARTATALYRILRSMRELSLCEELAQTIIRVRNSQQPYDQRAVQVALDDYVSLQREMGKEISREDVVAELNLLIPPEPESSNV